MRLSSSAGTVNVLARDFNPGNKAIEINRSALGTIYLIKSTYYFTDNISNFK